MPDFVDLDQGVPLFHGFDQLQVPRSVRLASE